MRKEYDFAKGKRGAVLASPRKTRITIMLDDTVIEHFRQIAETEGTGYQTVINAALRTSIVQSKARKSSDAPVTASVLRRILREQLRKKG